MDFKGKKILITGASSGIGAAVAKHFATKGAILFLSGRNLDALQEVKSNCSQAEEVHIYPMDLSDYDGVANQIKQIYQVHQVIDILINNAGITQRALAKDLPFEYDKKIIDVDLLGTIAVTKAVLPHMLDRKSGTIVTITSLMGKIYTPLRTSYAAAKHGLHGYFDSLRTEISDEGIQVLLVCPGFIHTNISYNAIGPQGKKQEKMDEAIQKGLAPEEVAKAIEKGICNKEEEVYVSGAKEMLGVYLTRFVPSLWSKVVKKIKVT